MSGALARRRDDSALDPFGRDVRDGLQESPRRIPPRWFYDDLGSALFDAICRLPWYEVTRAETRLLRQHAADVVAAARPDCVVELGPGNGEKIAIVARELAALGRPVGLHLVDVSPAALDAASRMLAKIPGARVTTDVASYQEGLARLSRKRAAIGRALVAFLGSNLGNFDASDAARLLTQIRGALRPGDALLLGLDLVKPPERLALAYDDPLGVTAAFNLNLLVRMNRELGATFRVEAFAHRATWSPSERRVEMHLVSLARQTADIPGADCRVDLVEGETIWTESSYKLPTR